MREKVKRSRSWGGGVGGGYERGCAARELPVKAGECGAPRDSHRGAFAGVVGIEGGGSRVPVAPSRVPVPYIRSGRVWRMLREGLGCLTR